jgi:hypothetical protein
VSAEPIVMENNGSERVEFCPRWNWPNGSVSYGPPSSRREVAQSFLDDLPAGVLGGVMQHRRIHTTPWLDADLPEELVGTPFLVGIGTSSGPLHAVEARHWTNTRRQVPTVCGKPAIIARDWGGFARGTRQVDTMELCSRCRWHVATATNTTAGELAKLTPSDAQQEALGRALPDPRLFVRLMTQTLGMVDEDSDIDAVAQILGHVTDHRPVLLMAEDCCEEACDHDSVQDCYGETPTVACGTCSFRAGGWAGEWEGWFQIPVSAPCSVLTATAAHYENKAVTS